MSSVPPLAAALGLTVAAGCAGPDRAELQLHLRSGAVERTETWDPNRTALIICDMWDDHWCRGAARRVAELAGPLDAAVRAARARGVFIIHAPSTTVAVYEGRPERRRA